MSYSYVPTGIAATGYTGFATYISGRLAGVTGSSGSAAITAPSSSDGILQSVADAILGAVGFQSMSDTFAVGSASTSSTSFVDVGNGSTTGFSSWTFTVPVSKTYLINVSLTPYMTTAGGSNNGYFQIVVDGVAPSGQPTSTARAAWASINDPKQVVFAVPVALTAGSHTVKLQWKVNNSSMVLTVNTDQGRTFWATG